MSWWSPWRGRLASFLGLSLGAVWVGVTAGAEASQTSLHLPIGEPSRRVLARVTDHWGGTMLVSRYVRSALEVKREAHTDSSTVAMPTRRRIIWRVRVMGVRRRRVSYTLAAIRCASPMDSRSRSMMRRRPGGWGRDASAGVAVVAGSWASWRPGVTRGGPGCSGPAWGGSVAGLAGVEPRRSTQSKAASEALLVSSFLRVCVICVTPALVSMPLNVCTRAWRNVSSVETTRRLWEARSPSIGRLAHASTCSATTMLHS